MAATFRGHKRPSYMQRYVTEFFDRRRLIEIGFSSDMTFRTARDLDLLMECHAKFKQLEHEQRKRQADRDRRK